MHGNDKIRFYYWRFMKLLIVISVIGFIISALLHIFAIFHVYRPPKALITTLNVGAAFLIYISIIISRRIRDRRNMEEFRKELFAVCPRWLSALTGFLIMYALGGLVFIILKKHFGNPPIDNKEGVIGGGIQGFLGHLMSLYAVAFSIIYCCGKIRKNHKDENSYILEE